MTFEGHIEELQQPSQKMGTSSCLHSRISKYQCERPSTYSLKIVLDGVEHYQIDGNNYKLESGQMLVVNQGEDLRALVDSKNITEGICIYPSQELVNEALYARMHSIEHVLENPFDGRNENHITTQSFQLNGEKHVSKTLFGYWNELRGVGEKSEGWWWQFYADLTEAMIEDQSTINRQICNLSSLKKHTKEELYRRVFKATEYMYDHKFERLDIDSLAEISTLSKYHFLRSFKAVFEQSPYQYALHLKLKAAKELVTKRYSYAQAANHVGYSDSGNLRKALRAYL